MYLKYCYRYIAKKCILSTDTLSKVSRYRYFLDTFTQQVISDSFYLKYSTTSYIIVTFCSRLLAQQIWQKNCSPNRTEQRASGCKPNELWMGVAIKVINSI